MTKRSTIAWAVLPVVTTMLAPVMAAPITWDGGGVTDNWSDGDNFSSDAPAGAADGVTFGAVDTRADGSVNNVVDASVAIDSLTYNHGADVHHTQVNSGQTLTISSASAGNVLTVGGGVTVSPTVTQISGAGTLTVNAASGAMVVGNRGPGGSTGRGELDLSGLSTFNATLSSIRVGSGDGAIGVLSLADQNTVTAGSMIVGVTDGGDTATNASQINLGRSNMFNVDAIGISAGVASNRSTSTMQFQTLAGLPTPSLTIRGAAGGASRADLTVAEGNSTSNGQLTGTLNLSGGSVDARLDDFTIGWARANAGSGATGVTTIGAGTVDANAVYIGRSIQAGNNANGTGIGTLTMTGGALTTGVLTLAQNDLATGTNTTRKNATGTLNVSGTASVSAAGDLLVGNVLGGAADVVATATVNVSGGTLDVTGDLTEGAGGADGLRITSKVDLTGGSTEVGGRIGVDALNLSGGSLHYHGAGAAGTVGTIAKVGATGPASVLTFDPAPGSSAVINAGTLTNTSGVLLIKAPSLGQQAAGTADASNLTFSTTPTLTGAGAVDTTTRGVIARTFAASSATGTDYRAVTHDVNGVRRLNSNEFVGTVTAGQNVIVTDVQTNTGTTTVNSLQIGAGGRITGGTAIGVTSGDVLIAGGENLGITTALTGSLNITAINDLVGGNYNGGAILTKYGPGAVSFNTTDATIIVNEGTLTANGGEKGKSVTVNGGTFRLGASNSLLNTASITINARGTFEVAAGASDTAGALNGAGVLSGGAGSSLTSSSSSNATFSGRIIDGLSLTKAGTGTLTLSGANTYTGSTTVSAGTLRVNGSLGDTIVTVAAAGTLGGTGTIGGATSVTGTLAPGASAGLLTFADTLALSGTSAYEADGLTRGVVGGHDAVNVADALTYGGILNVAFTATFADGSAFDLFDFAEFAGNFTAINLTGSYTASLTDGGDGTWSGTAGEQVFAFNTSTGVLAIVAVPEPGSVGLAAIVGGALLARRRTRGREVTQAR